MRTETSIPLIEQICAARPGTCIIALGSSGLGELTVSTDGVRHSDVEIGVVGGIRALIEARRISRQHPDVEVAWVSTWRMRFGLQRNICSVYPNVQAFDLARCPMFGPLPKRAGTTKQWSSEDLGSWQAIDLLMNRIAEMTEHGATAYSLVKVAVACGDALLLHRGEYRFGYQQRRETLAAADPLLPPTATDVAQDGYEQKLSGNVRGINEGQLKSAVIATLTHIIGDPRWQPALWAEVHEDFARLRNQRSRPAAGPFGRSIDVLGAIVRGRRRLGIPQTCRGLSKWRSIDAAVYAALLRSFVVSSVAAGQRGWTVPVDVPSELASDRQTLVNLWHCYCY